MNPTADTHFAELAPQLMDGRLAVTVGCDSPTIRPLCLDRLPPAWDEAEAVWRMELPTAAARTLWRTVDYCWLDPAWAGLPAPQARHGGVVWHRGGLVLELRFTDWRFTCGGVEVPGYPLADAGIRGADVTDQMRLYGARFADLVWRFARGLPVIWSGMVPRGWKATAAPTLVFEARSGAWAKGRWLFALAEAFVPAYGDAALAERPVWATPLAGRTLDEMLDHPPVDQLPPGWTAETVGQAIPAGTRSRWRRALAAAGPLPRHRRRPPVVVRVGRDGRCLGARLQMTPAEAPAREPEHAPSPSDAGGTTPETETPSPPKAASSHPRDRLDKLRRTTRRRRR